jgi:hypothetical protein
MHTPRNITHPTPDTLELREGGGCMTLFGLFFLLPGLGMFAAGIAHLLGNRIISDPAPGAAPVLLVMGLIFSVVGGGVTFSRTWYLFDRVQRIVAKRWGLLVPLRNEPPVPLDAFTRVHLQRDPGGSDSSETFPVSLSGDNAEFSLPANTKYGESRTLATYLATFLTLPLLDETTEHAEETTPADNGASLAQRLAEGSVNPDSAPLPPVLRSQVVPTQGGILLTIPPHPKAWLGSLLMCLPAGIFLAIVLAQAPLRVSIIDAVHAQAWPVIIFFTIFFAFPGSFMLGALLSLLRNRTEITASAAGMTITRFRGLKRTHTVLTPEMILGLDYSTATEVSDGIDQRVSASPAAGCLSVITRNIGSRGVTLKTPNGLESFAEGLPDDEVRYLYAVLTHALAGRISG